MEGRFAPLLFLDMDGVLADFVGGCCKAHGRPSPYLRPESLGAFDMAKLWGISAHDFWAPCEGPGFWDELEETREARAIVRLALDLFGEGAAVLTAPSMSPYCVPGKRRWMRKHFPALEERMIFTGAKRFLAGPGRTLVDDRDENVDGFKAAGGEGLLLPRPWNRSHRGSTLAYAIFKEQISFVSRRAAGRQGSDLGAVDALADQEHGAGPEVSFLGGSYQGSCGPIPTGEGSNQAKER